VPDRESPQVRLWREQAALQQRNVQRLLFQNAQLIVLLGAIMPGLWEFNMPHCVSCGIELPPRSTKHCSARCRNRAWRARRFADAA